MKTNGYRASHRNKWLLLQNKVLTQDELMLLEFYIDQMDFDGTHDKGGMFEYFPEEIAPIFCKKSTDTIKGWHDGLANKGFVTIADAKRNLWSIPNRERYITNAGHMGNASKYAKEEKDCSLETILSNSSYFPDSYENFPPFKAKELKSTASIAITSSKDQLSSISIKKIPSSSPSQHVRSLKEYEDIRKEGYQMTVDELIFIDRQKLT